MTEIAVLGCGVIGLICAIQLQQAGFEVTIITRDMPEETTSAAAGTTNDLSKQWCGVCFSAITPNSPRPRRARGLF